MKKMQGYERHQRMPYCKNSVAKLNTADMNESTMDMFIYAHDFYICIFSMNIVGTNNNY